MRKRTDDQIRETVDRATKLYSQRIRDCKCPVCQSKNLIYGNFGKRCCTCGWTFSNY